MESKEAKESQEFKKDHKIWKIHKTPPQADKSSEQLMERMVFSGASDNQGRKL